MLGLIFTYLMTAYGAVAGLFRPYHALLLYISFAILKPESLWFWSVPIFRYSLTVGIAMLAGWAIAGFGKWEFGRARGVVMALILYGLWILVGATFSTNQTVGWLFVEKQAKIILPFLVGITCIDSVQKLKQLAWVLVLSQGYLAWWFHDIIYLKGEYIFAGVDVYTFSGLDNNSIAIGMCTCVGLAFFLGLTVARWWQRAICFLCAALMAHSVMFMYSRGGMVALLITGVVSFL